MLEIQVKIDVWSEPNKKGESRLIKKNLIIKRCIDINSIQEVGQIFNSRGRVLKRECLISINDDKVIVNHSYEEMIKFKKAIEIKGFKYERPKRKRKV